MNRIKRYHYGSGQTKLQEDDDGTFIRYADYLKEFEIVPELKYEIDHLQKQLEELKSGDVWGEYFASLNKFKDRAEKAESELSEARARMKPIEEVYEMKLCAYPLQLKEEVMREYYRVMFKAINQACEKEGK